MTGLSQVWFRCLISVYMTRSERSAIFIGKRCVGWSNKSRDEFFFLGATKCF